MKSATPHPSTKLPQASSSTEVTRARSTQVTLSGTSSRTCRNASCQPTWRASVSRKTTQPFSVRRLRCVPKVQPSRPTRQSSLEVSDQQGALKSQPLRDLAKTLAQPSIQSLASLKRTKRPFTEMISLRWSRKARSSNRTQLRSWALRCLRVVRDRLRSTRTPKTRATTLAK